MKKVLSVLGLIAILGITSPAMAPPGHHGPGGHGPHGGGHRIHAGAHHRPHIAPPHRHHHYHYGHGGVKTTSKDFIKFLLASVLPTLAKVFCGEVFASFLIKIYLISFC
mgnify:CR=1 FL=1